VGKIDEVLIVFAQLFNDLAISLELSGHVLHGVENENPLWNIIILVGGKPIWENSIWGFRFLFLEFYHLDTRTLQCLLKVVELHLGLNK
jgi:hypothetical protein